MGAEAKSAGRRPAREQNEGRTSNERAARARTEEAFQERQYQRLEDYYQDTGRPSRSPRRSLRTPPLGVQQSIRKESPDSSPEPGPLRAVAVLGPERPLNCSDDDQWMREDGFFYLDGAETSDDEKEGDALARRTPTFCNRLSRLITRILRHSPSDCPHKETGGIYVTSLTRLIRETFWIRSSDIKHVVQEDNRGRFELRQVETGGRGEKEFTKSMVRATRSKIPYIKCGLSLYAECRWICSSAEVKKAGNRAAKMRQKTRKQANITELAGVKQQLAKQERTGHPDQSPPPDTGDSMGSKGSKGSKGKGKGKASRKGKFGMCSVHEKQRSMEALNEDGKGGFLCKDDMECKPSAAEMGNVKSRR